MKIDENWVKHNRGIACVTGYMKQIVAQGHVCSKLCRIEKNHMAKFMSHMSTDSKDSKAAKLANLMDFKPS